MTDLEIIETGESIKWVYLPMQDQIIAFARLIAAAQREIDAGICEKLVYENGVASQCARAIRKGGKS
jgi:hypothetical protein